RDNNVVDTVNGYYANFADKMSTSYGQWRHASFDELEKEERTRNQARMRTFLGAAAVLASVFVPGQCNAYDYNCRRIESAPRPARPRRRRNPWRSNRRIRPGSAHGVSHVRP